MSGVLQIRELSREEIDTFLQRHSHGRIAYSFRDRVDIEPIHYVWRAPWLYGRTTPGAKLTTWQRNPWVAFEVDEVRNTFDWTSVVAKGTVYLVGEEATAHAADTFADVVDQLRRLVPTTFTPDDPVPEREVLFRVHVDEIRGREGQYVQKMEV